MSDATDKPTTREPQPLQFEGTASGTAHQIATMLRSFANDIERWDHTKMPQPWYTLISGSCRANLNVK